MTRKKPYTAIGIRRLKCFRCSHQAEYQWQICADGNVYRPICGVCDRLLNRLVLEFMRFPPEEVDVKMAVYAH